MAGYSRIYCIGERGGFDGADGINPILLQIWVGDADRQWLKGHYFSDEIKPLGRIKSIVPQAPDDPDALLDACLAFYPDFFNKAPSLAGVREQARELEHLDFNLGTSSIPEGWSRLREEARPLFKDMVIFEADLRPLE
jgi:hypothetical protein